MEPDRTPGMAELWQEWELLETMAVSAPRATLPELDRLARQMAIAAQGSSTSVTASELDAHAEMRAVREIAQRIEVGDDVTDDEVLAALKVLRSFVERLSAALEPG